MKKRFLLSLAIIVGSLSPTGAQISVSTEKPIQGENITISLAQPDSMVVITYRPNSSLAQRDTLRAPALAATFQWTPARAGVVALSTSAQGSRNVSVRYRGLSGSGLLVLILAGTILLGGAGFAFGLLFKNAEDESMEELLEHRADT